MIAMPNFERAALDALEPRWRQKGYTLIRQPAAHQLPSFLDGFRPDAIAIGAEPSLVIEVLQPREESGVTNIRRMRRLFEGHADWRLEVVYASAEYGPMAPAELPAILAIFAEARNLSSQGNAALLLAWGGLEAVGRLLEPTLASYSLSPAALVDLLVSQGHVLEIDGRRLRSLAKQRHGLAHGDLSVRTTFADVDILVELGLSLARSVEAIPAPDLRSSSPPAA